MYWPYFVALAALTCSLYCVYVVRDVRRKLNEATTFMVNRDKQVTELAAACNRDVERLEAQLLDMESVRLLTAAEERANSEIAALLQSEERPTATLNLDGAIRPYIPGRTTINFEVGPLRNVSPEQMRQFISRGPLVHTSKPAELPKPPEPPAPPTWHERLTDDEEDPV